MTTITDPGLINRFSPRKHPEAAGNAHQLQQRSPHRSRDQSPHQSLYRSLSQPGLTASALPAASKSAAHDYLRAQLALVEDMETDLPSDPVRIGTWIDQGVAQSGDAYRAYLDQRKMGGARRFFPTRSHALHFLGAVAPTKLVDGAWLYGLTAHWQDPRFMPLIRTYLEELGEGAPDKNHVALYRRLLAAESCDSIGELDDRYYAQGAIQLCLGYLAGEFLPEVIGFNLGYEQLPLHLLITAYELNELGIDPYYFTLHITIDNAASGHARQALRGLEALMPQFELNNAAAFYRRVRNGYKLNTLGVNTLDIIDDFVLDDEVKAIFSGKALVGSMVHSDYCRIGDRSVREWLADRSQIPVMLDALQQTGWIKRHQPLENSRFWQLIQSERATMFGVFNAYEQQVIADWIIGDAAALLPRPHSFRARQRLLEKIAPKAELNTAPEDTPENRSASHAGSRNDVDAEIRTFEQTVAAMESRSEVMNFLVDAIGPNMHWRPSGLAATRLFNRLLGLR